MEHFSCCLLGYPELIAHHMELGADFFCWGCEHG